MRAFRGWIRLYSFKNKPLLPPAERIQDQNRTGYEYGILVFDQVLEIDLLRGRGSRARPPAK
jgi:hypothetical protein